MNTNQREIRIMVRSMYDLQKMRIETGNRIVAEFRNRLGQEPGQKTEEGIDVDGQKLIDSLLQDYKRLTDGVVRLPTIKKFQPGKLIDTPALFFMLDNYNRELQSENGLLLSIKKVVETFEIWQLFLDDVRGCGPLMAGVILSEIDIHKAKYASSIWKYAGLDVASDGRGRGRFKEHLVDTEYTDADGKTQTKKGITFSPFLKTKLVGVLGSSFIKQPADKCKYRKIYDDYKHRLENHPNHIEKTKLHRHNMAVRYMVKQFLVDLYDAWRAIEDLPVHPPYHIAKLGMVPHGMDKAA